MRIKDIFPSSRTSRIFKKIKGWIAPVGIVLGAFFAFIWGRKSRRDSINSTGLDNVTRGVQRAKERHERIGTNQQKSKNLNRKSGEFTEKLRGTTDDSGEVIERARGRIQRIDNILTRARESSDSSKQE